jgi:hypothetical protein
VRKREPSEPPQENLKGRVRSISPLIKYFYCEQRGRRRTKRRGKDGEEERITEKLLP